VPLATGGQAASGMVSSISGDDTTRSFKHDDTLGYSKADDYRAFEQAEWFKVILLR